MVINYSQLLDNFKKIEHPDVGGPSTFREKYFALIFRFQKLETLFFIIIFKVPDFEHTNVQISTPTFF